MHNFNLSSDSRRHQEADTSLPYAVQLPDLCFVHPTDVDNPMPTFSIEIKVWRLKRSLTKFMNLYCYGRIVKNVQKVILAKFTAHVSFCTAFNFFFQPKCGFLPSPNTINPNNAVKTEVCRFCMHKHLKVRFKNNLICWEFVWNQCRKYCTCILQIVWDGD